MEEFRESEQEDEIIEGAEYSPKSEFSKPRLVEEAVKKCVEARSKEMKEGYYNYKLDKESGKPIAKIWIPDTRKIFDSHVIALRNLLDPEIKKDKPFQEAEKKFIEEKKTLFEKYCYEKRIEKFVENDGEKVIRWVRTGYKEIPEKDAPVVVTDMITNLAMPMVGGWNDKIFSYWNEKVSINDKIFAELNCLIDKLNYFKASVNY